MKKVPSYLTSSFLLTAILFLSVAKFQAQISIGVAAGPSYSTITFEEEENLPVPDLIQSGYTPGYFISVPIEFTLKGSFALQTEVSFFQKGTRLHFQESEDPLNSYTFEASNTLNYVQIPLLMKFKVGKGIFRTSLYAGPSVSYLSSGNSYSRIDAIIMGENFTNETEEPLELEDDTFNRWEFAAIVGLGFELDAGPGAITLDLRYQQGLSNLNSESELRANNQGFLSAVGYKITF